MSEQVSQMRNPDTLATHAGIKEVVNYKFSVKYPVTVLSNFRNGGVWHRVRRSNLMETKSWSWEAHVISHYNTFKPQTYSHLSIIRLSIQFGSVQSLSHV